MLRSILLLSLLPMLLFLISHNIAVKQAKKNGHITPKLLTNKFMHALILSLVLAIVGFGVIFFVENRNAGPDDYASPAQKIMREHAK